MTLAIDQVRVGDYLLCTKGPIRQVRDQFERIIDVVDRSTEGTLFRVKAISGAMMFMTVYPVPCGNIHAHDHRPWTGVFDFNRAQWQKAAPSFVKTYLGAMRVKPQRRPEDVALHPMDDMLMADLEDMFAGDEEDEDDGSDPH